MISKATARERAASLLDALLMGQTDDDRVAADLVDLETCTDNAVLSACHKARHFIADRDIHARDPAYAREQRSLLGEMIRDLRARVL